jgi:ppGpp synthetase/RelA/SpoT-type nucleotidyltranferase
MMEGEELFLGCRANAETFATTAGEALRHHLSRANRLLIDKHHSISWRVKSPEAIHAKVAKLRRQGREVSWDTVSDLIGFRVIAIHSAALRPLEEMLAAWRSELGLVCRHVQDYFQNPKEAGYRAIHFQLMAEDAPRWGLPQGITVEFQLTTWLSYWHAMLSHELFYKSGVGESGQSRSFLESLAERLIAVEALTANHLANFHQLDVSGHANEAGKQE